MRHLACFLALLVLALLAGCGGGGSSASGGGSPPPAPVTLGTIAFDPAASQAIIEAGSSVPPTVLYGRNSSGTGGQTKTYSYAAATVAGVPGIRVTEAFAIAGVPSGSSSWVLAISTDGKVYSLEFDDAAGPGIEFQASAATSPVLFLPYVAGALTAGTSFTGGRTPAESVNTSVTGVNTSTPLGITGATQITPTPPLGLPAEPWWFVPGLGVVETYGEFSIVPPPVGG